eukprot:COSAG01_NODE_45631_length_407_cov_3.198052_1_plen_43_part_01
MWGENAHNDFREEMMHDIDIFPEDWGGGHEQSLRHDFHLITSA